MNIVKIIIVLAMFLELGSIGLWVAHGTEIYTKDSEWIAPVTEKDELFGGERTVTEGYWKDNFKFGLIEAGPIVDMPFIPGPRCVAVVGGTGFVLFIVGILIHKKKKQHVL